LKSFPRIIVAFGKGLFVWLTLPIVPYSEDRIHAATNFQRAIALGERRRQELYHWSILSVLRRAARRQERMNVRGRAWYEKLERRPWRRRDTGLLYVTLFLRIGAVLYGFHALGAVLHDYFPAGHAVWQLTLDRTVQVLNWPFNWFVEHVVEKYRQSVFSSGSAWSSARNPRILHSCRMVGFGRPKVEKDLFGASPHLWELWALRDSLNLRSANSCYESSRIPGTACWWSWV
jgi:hypothetical protein